jgi:hypothetical protein
LKKNNSLFSITGSISGTSTVMAVYAKSDVAGGYDTGFARGVQEAHAAINQFDKGPLKSIDADKPPSCTVDSQDDYCDGWKDGWRQTVLDELD